MANRAMLQKQRKMKRAYLKHPRRGMDPLRWKEINRNATSSLALPNAYLGELTPGRLAVPPGRIEADDAKERLEQTDFKQWLSRFWCEHLVHGKYHKLKLFTSGTTCFFEEIKVFANGNFIHKRSRVYKGREYALRVHKQGNIAWVSVL